MFLKNRKQKGKGKNTCPPSFPHSSLYGTWGPPRGPSSLHPLERARRVCVLRRCRLAPVFGRLRPVPPRVPRSAPRLPCRQLTSRDQMSPALPSPSLLPLGGNVVNGVAAARLPLPSSPPLYPCYKARALTSISWFLATSHLSSCLLLAVKIIVDRSVVPIVRRR
jgi:hypothetical protein